MRPRTGGNAALAATALLVLLAAALPAAVVALGAAAPRVPGAGTASVDVPVYGPALAVLALVGYRAASRTQASSCGGLVPVPRAIATDYPAVDLVDGYRHGATGGPPLLDARHLAVTYTGGTPEQVPDRYRAVSGAAALTPVAPPTLVIAPARDSLVPPAGLGRFVATAQAAGVDAELVSVPVANHAFDQLRDGSLGQQAGWSVLGHWAAEHVAPGR